MMVLVRRVGTETQLQRVTAGWWNHRIEKQWTVQFWSYDLISEVSTNGVFILMSRLCHVRLCDVASPVPSWHRLRRGGVTFRDSTCWTLLAYARQFLLWAYFIYLLWCIRLFGLELWSILDVNFTSKLWNVEEGSVICIMSVLVLVYSGRDVSSN